MCGERRMLPSRRECTTPADASRSLARSPSDGRTHTIPARRSAAAGVTSFTVRVDRSARHVQRKDSNALDRIDDEEDPALATRATDAIEVDPTTVRGIDPRHRKTLHALVVERAEETLLVEHAVAERNAAILEAA